jgi:hypothetical protein
MNIEDFVKAALVQITQGIVKAQKQLGSSGALINPLMESPNAVGTPGPEQGVKLGEFINFIEFDLAVTSSEGTETKGGLSVTGWTVVKADAGGSSQRKQGTESRIKFKIPVGFPQQPASYLLLGTPR